MPAVEGAIVAERFRLERPLGQGGMGAVWLAQQLSLDVPCAVKFLHPEAAASPDLVARFEREAKAAAQLRSPNVVQVFDHGLWEGMPFIAMELLDGEDLDQRIERVRRLDPRATAEIIAQVARALTKAHAAGLVHRDLKPANIFLARDDDREIVKVLDFGIAKHTNLDVGGTKTKTGALFGTPSYMSPEQARGLREVDHRTDLWALGVIAFQCLTGQLPFDSEALGDLFMKIMNDPLPVPSTLAPLPTAFDAWWARAASRDPEARFQSARELSDALSVALGVATAGAEPEARSSALPAAPITPPPVTHAAAAVTGPRPSQQTASAVAVPAAPTGITRNTVISILPGALALIVAAGLGFMMFRSRNEAPAATPARIATADVSASAAAVAPPIVTVASAAPPPPAIASAVPSTTATAAATSAPKPSAAARATSPAPKPPPAKPKPVAPSHHDDGI